MFSEKETSVSASCKLLIFLTSILLFGGCDKEEEVDPAPKYLLEHGSTSDWIEVQQAENVRTLSALVLAADSTPKPGVTVFFKIESGQAALSSATAVTDAEGIASVAITLGSKIGDVVIKAEAYSLSGSPLYYYFYIRAGIPFAIEVLSGDQQEALANARLPDKFVVKVTDKFGNPVPHVHVAFDVKEGGGKLLWNSSVTNNDGIANNQFTVGETSPINLVAATIGSATINFTAYTLLAVELNPPLSQKDHVSLTWSKSRNSTFSHYTIHRSPASTYDFEQIGEITDVHITAFTDHTAVIGQPYNYFIRANTSNGNKIDSKQKNGVAGEYIDLISESHVRDVLVNSDRSLLYISDPIDKMIRIFSTDNLQKTDSIPLTQTPNRINLSADETKLYATVSGTAKFMILDLASKAVLQTIDISTALNSTSIIDIYQAKNGQLFATGYGGYILKIDEDNAFATKRIANNKVFFAGSPTFLGDHNNDLYVVESNLSPNSLIKIDMSTDDAPLILEAGHGYVDGTKRAVISPDGEHIYTTAGQMLNTDNFKTEGQLQNTAYGVQVSGISNRLFASFYGGSFLNKGKFAVLDRSTLLSESEMYLGFTSTQIFLSMDEEHAFLFSVDQQRNCRIYKINVPL